MMCSCVTCGVMCSNMKLYGLEWCSVWLCCIVWCGVWSGEVWPSVLGFGD